MMRALKDPRMGAYIVAIGNQGWSLDQISKALGVTRERVRQIRAAHLTSGLRVSIAGLPAINEPMMQHRKQKRMVKAKRTAERRAAHEVAVEDVARLKAAFLLSKRLRSGARPDSPEYVSAMEVVSISKKYIDNGVPIRHLAHLIGVPQATFDHRLRRHGLLESVGQSHSVRTIQMMQPKQEGCQQ